MILEFIEFISNIANKTEQEKIYLMEIIATKYRYKRNKKKWLNHLNKTKDSIKKFCSDKSGVCIILGSGNLLDIPVDYLVSKFTKVVMVDYIHLKSVKKKYSHQNIEFKEIDLAGISSEALLKALNYKSVDVIISVNLLSQLPLLKLEIDNLSTVEYTKAYSEIISRHITMMKSLTSSSLIITEVSRKTKNEEIELFEFNSEWESINEWEWNFIPGKNFQSNLVKVFIQKKLK